MANEGGNNNEVRLIVNQETRRELANVVPTASIHEFAEQLGFNDVEQAYKYFFEVERIVKRSSPTAGPPATPFVHALTLELFRFEFGRQLGEAYDSAAGNLEPETGILGIVQVVLPAALITRSCSIVEQYFLSANGVHPISRHVRYSRNSVLLGTQWTFNYVSRNYLSVTNAEKFVRAGLLLASESVARCRNQAIHQGNVAVPDVVIDDLVRAVRRVWNAPMVRYDATVVEIDGTGHEREINRCSLTNAFFLDQEGAHECRFLCVVYVLAYGHFCVKNSRALNRQLHVESPFREDDEQRNRLVNWLGFSYQRRSLTISPENLELVAVDINELFGHLRARVADGVRWRIRWTVAATEVSMLELMNAVVREGYGEPNSVDTGPGRRLLSFLEHHFLRFVDRTVPENHAATLNMSPGDQIVHENY